MMLTALLATAAVASFFSLRRLAAAACRALDATLAAKRDPAAEAEEEEVDDGAAAAAARAKAAAHLRAVLDTPTSSLEVPAIQYARDAAINPMMGQRMAEAKAEAERERRREAARLALASARGGASARGAGTLRRGNAQAIPAASMPKRTTGLRPGILRFLNWSYEDPAAEASVEGRMRAVHRFLKRDEGVQTLQNAAHNPDIAANLERNTRQRGLADSAERSRHKHLQRSREDYRSQLKELGWAGDESLAEDSRDPRWSRRSGVVAGVRTRRVSGAVLDAAAAAAARNSKRGSAIPRASLMPAPPDRISRMSRARDVAGEDDTDPSPPERRSRAVVKFAFDEGSTDEHV